MALERQGTHWMDARLDGLDLMIRESVLRTERDLSALRRAVDHRFREVDKRIDHVDRRIDSVQQTLILGLFAFICVLIVGLSFVSLVGR